MNMNHDQYDDYEDQPEVEVVGAATDTYRNKQVSMWLAHICSLMSLTMKMTSIKNITNRINMKMNLQKMKKRMKMITQWQKNLNRWSNN